MKRLAMMVTVMAVSGCASVPPAQPASSAAPGDVAAFEAAQQQHEAALGLADGQCAAPTWSMVGRVALSNGKDGGSGRIEWSQADAQAVVTLSAPVTRQSWTLRTDPTGAVLDGVPNGPRRGTQADSLLREATGWQIPVGALGCWLRGARAGTDVGAASIRYDANGRPARIEQAGWQIDYSGWGEDGGLRVPTRINAQRGDDRVRLIVDGWGGE